MRLVLLWSLAACTFHEGFPGGSGDDSSGDPGGSGSGSGSSGTPGNPTAPDAGAPACPDDDADGTCNASDDWPCGIKPAEPPATLMFTNNGGQTVTTISNVSLDSTGRLAIATPGETIRVTLTYDIRDTACASACIDQIEVGWVTGKREACVFSGTVPEQGGAQGNATTNLAVPTAPGVYDFRVNLGQNFSCTANGANNWWQQTAGGPEPDASRTVAKLCVR